MPADPVEEARCIASMAWFSNIVHPSYQRQMRPERFAEGEAAQATVKDMGRKSFWANCQEIDSMLQDKNWLMGDQYSVADGYALVFYGWGVRGGFPMQELAHYTAWKERMLQRPTVRKILESEQNVLVKAA
jgi:glutathione S-transferase